jgi:hypothetical protein
MTLMIAVQRQLSEGRSPKKGLTTYTSKTSCCANALESAKGGRETL